MYSFHKTIECSDLKPCSCGKMPTASIDTLYYDYDPRDSGWKYASVIECECGNMTVGWDYSVDLVKNYWNQGKYVDPYNLRQYVLRRRAAEQKMCE